MPTTTGSAQLTIHDQASAPDEAKPILADIAEKYGFTPSLYRIFAGAPAALKTYLQVAEQFASTSLSKPEQQVVLLSAAIENGCHFCKAAHTWTATAAGVSEADIQAVRDSKEPADARLAAVSRFTRHLVRERGHGDKAEIARFIDAGFERHQILEVLVGVTLKTLSNYTNHLADTPIDEQLQPFA